MRGDLIETFKIVRGLSGIRFGDFFEYIPTNGTRGHDFRIQRCHSRLEIRAKFFTNRNKLPEKVVSCTNVDTFKKLLDECWDTVFPDIE